jgi:hypothetical protein
MRKKLKSSSDGGKCYSKNAKEAVVAPMVDSVEAAFGGGVWSQAVGFVLVRLAGI